MSHSREAHPQCVMRVRAAAAVSTYNRACMDEPSPRGTRVLAFAALVAGLVAWSFAVWLGPNATAVRLIESPLFTDFDVYRDQLLRFGSQEHAVSARWYYPPFAAVLLWPLRAAEPTARAGFWLLQLALVAGLCRSCFRLLERLPRGPRLAAAVGFTLACYPVLCCLAWGQVGLLVTCLALRSLTSHRRSLGWLGAAVAFKLYPLLFALGHVVRLELRVLMRLAAWVGLLGVLVPLLWLGPTTTLQLLGVALSVAARTRGPRFDIDQTLDGFLTRLVYMRSQFDAEPDGLWFSLPQPLALALTVSASVALVAYTLWRTRALPAHDPLAVAAVLLCTTLLIKPGWPHYWVVLPYAQAALLARAQRTRDLVSCALSVTCSALPLASLGMPSSLGLLQEWGLLTLAALSALFGITSTAAQLRTCAEPAARAEPRWRGTPSPEAIPSGLHPPASTSAAR